MRINVVIIYFVIGTLSIVANTSKQLYSVDKKIPSYLFDVNKTEKINRTQVLSRQEILQDLLFLNSNTSIMIANSLKDVNGGYHDSYKEIYKGVEVDGTRCTVHYNKYGEMVSVNGNFRTIEGLKTIPFVNESNALEKATSYIEDSLRFREYVVNSIKSVINCNKQLKSNLVYSYYPISHISHTNSF
jgi:Zn-dependent metalloprotease